MIVNPFIKKSTQFDINLLIIMLCNLLLTTLNPLQNDYEHRQEMYPQTILPPLHQKLQVEQTRKEQVLGESHQ